MVFRLRYVPSSKRYLFLILRLLVLEEPGLPGKRLQPFLIYLQILPAKIRVPLLKGVFDADFEVLGHSPGLAYIYELLPVPAVPGHASTGAGSGAGRRLRRVSPSGVEFDAVGIYLPHHLRPYLVEECAPSGPCRRGAPALGANDRPAGSFGFELRLTFLAFYNHPVPLSPGFWRALNNY